MRETVQTKMARLERKIRELELEQKELKKQNKLLQKGGRQNLCEIEKIHKVEVSTLNAEIARLKRENEELKNTKEELVKDKVALISRAYNSGKTKEEIRELVGGKDYYIYADELERMGVATIVNTL